MGFADLHIHTIHSYDGTATVPAVLKHVADHTDLDVIAITDHDSLAGLQEGLMLAPRYGLEVIPGCEVTTSEGHLLALFIDRPIQAGLSYIPSGRLKRRAASVWLATQPHAASTASPLKYYRKRCGSRMLKGCWWAWKPSMPGWFTPAAMPTWPK